MLVKTACRVPNQQCTVNVHSHLFLNTSHFSTAATKYPKEISMDFVNLVLMLGWALIMLSQLQFRIYVTPLPNNDKQLIPNFVNVGPDGDINPVYFNPAYRNQDEKPIKHLDPNAVIKKSDERIVGGRTAKKAEAPYQVAIYSRRGKLWCGGTIYNRMTIITAAHCIYNGANVRSASEFIFAVGLANVRQHEKTEMQRISHKIIVHPDYDVTSMISDLAIIKLNKSLRYTFHIQPLELGDPKDDDVAVISGWGYTRVRAFGSGFDSAGFHSTLALVEIKIIPKAECAEMYGKVADNLKALAEHPNYICAGVRTGGTDACSGDSGGPLACVTPSGIKNLCGVVSSGIGCGLPGQPGFYMNMTVFRPWIEQHAGKADKPKRTK